ncbi:hypothetical protein F4805DRAFT_475192 [Annulohypoxylon moriforme]|nr:hypothetical protein F4805DRAFT_475192 [Annulohypoxylon moriforme]
MPDPDRSEIIRKNPIGNGLDSFHISFNSVCENRNIPCSPEALVQLSQEDIQDLASSLLASLQILPITRLLPSSTGRGTLRNNLLTLISAIASNNFDYDRVKPLLAAVIAKKSDKEIWDQVYNAITESTPPPRPIASSLQQTPAAPKAETLYLVREDGAGGYRMRIQDGVLSWFTNIIKKLAALTEKYNLALIRRRPLVQPNKPIQGFTAEWKIDVGFTNKAQLRFNPTIITSGSKQYIKIDRNGIRERLVIDVVIRRAPYIAGRTTTYWKAHSENNLETPLVVKDSWQYIKREKEGKLLQEATNKNVVNVEQYYHHYTIQVHGINNDIQSNVWKGLDITTAENYRPQRSTNRIHRRVIIRDYGKPICEASSRAALLSALEDCIIGHESLRRAGILHRDISINNLMINKDNNPSWPAFLIDLDFAIREQRESASGAKGKTGTRAFMAIGALLGEHSFVHDLESFFWVLFWICIHYNGPGKNKVVPKFDKWNYMDMDELATLKVGTVSKEEFFIKILTQYFTPYYAPLIPWVNKLRKVIFGNNGPGADLALYSRILEVLRKAQKDKKVLSNATSN